MSELRSKRIAVIVQRCDPGRIVGGSESLAWQYATLLRDAGADVEILTTCAVDYISWKNELPAGDVNVEGVTIRRFPVLGERSSYFTELHRRLIDDFQAGELVARWPRALQEEFIRAQGPWSPQLLDHLRDNAEKFDAFVFCTYLYPTTYFGLREVPAARTILVPTLHDEAAAYLPVFRDAAAGARHCVWLTEAERDVAARCWGIDAGTVVGMAVEAVGNQGMARDARQKYFLYVGRIDQEKGCRVLLSAFDTVRSTYPGKLGLILAGSMNMDIGSPPQVEFMGFVDEAEKLRLMAGATAFVMPSAYESFSIVTLEAMSCGAPVLVNEECRVLAGHVQASAGGRSFLGEAGLVLEMNWALGLDADYAAQISENGKRYVREGFSRDVIRRKLVWMVREVTRETAEDGETPVEPRQMNDSGQAS